MIGSCTSWPDREPGVGLRTLVHFAYCGRPSEVPAPGNCVAAPQLRRTAQDWLPLSWRPNIDIGGERDR